MNKNIFIVLYTVRKNLTFEIKTKSNLFKNEKEKEE